MYRAVIEHPEWIPDDWEKRLDLRAGSEQGRIYRVYPVDKKPRPIPRLDRLDTAGLVAALDSPSGWQRDTAQRLLVAPARPGRDRAAAQAGVEHQAAQDARPGDLDAGRSGRPRRAVGAGRPHGSASPGARERDRGGRGRLRGSSPQVAEAVLRLADDADPQVRFQLALALGNWNDRRAGEALARLARRDGNDPWMRAAVLSSAVPHVATLLASSGRWRRRASAPPPAIVEPLLALAGSLPDRRLNDGGRSIDRRAGRAGGALRPLAVRRAGGVARSPRPVQEAARPRPRQAVRTALERGTAVWSRTTRPPRPTGSRPIRLLGHAAERSTDDRDLLVGLLAPQVSVAVQQAAVAALGRTTDPKVADLLVRDWKRHSPQVRGAILDVLLSRTAWTSSLLSSLEDGCVPPAEIDPARRQRLLAHRDPAIRGPRGGRLRPPGQAAAGGRRRLSPGPGRQGRPRRRRGRLQEAVRILPSAGQRGRRGRSRPRQLERQVARVAPDRDPRPQPGVRVEVRQLHRRDRRRPRLERPDRQRVGHRGDPPPPGGQGRRAAPLRHRGDGRLGPVAHARGARERPETPATSPT